MSRIRVEGLTRRFGQVVAVDDVWLDVADGEFLVLLGPSGCGKSTLLRMIAGLLPPSEGRVLLGETDITHTPPQRRDLAMVFQSYALYPHLTVARNIAFPLRARGLSKEAMREKVSAVAKTLDLGGLLERRPKELSGGQRQRVALGRALVRDPGAFLMDEPLSNLDAKLRSSTRAEITALHRDLGATVLYVTHDQVEAMTMATRIALLNEGRVEQVGTPSEVYDEPASVFVARFLGSPPMNVIEAVVHAGDDGRLSVRANGVNVPLDLAAEVPPGREVLLGIRPEHLTVTGTEDMTVAGPEQMTVSGHGQMVAADPETAGLRGNVTAVENLGGEEIAYCQAGENRFCVRGPRPLGPAAGQDAHLAVRAERLHLFDPADGRRLAWRPASVTV